jgi:hypothetical protein
MSLGTQRFRLQISKLGTCSFRVKALREFVPEVIHLASKNVKKAGIT